jgi:rubrerythrin
MHALAQVKPTNIDTELHVNHHVIEHLRALIRLDFDASRSYEQALEYVDDETVRQDFESFRRDHERHIVELTSVVEDLGVKVEEVTRDIKGVVLESMTKLRSITGTLGALRAIRTNEKLSSIVYAKANRLDLPPLALETVTRALEDEKRHEAAIEDHIARVAAEEQQIEVPQSHRY